MGKRLNPYRRAAAFAEAARLQARLMTAGYNDADAAKLQQGHVRSHVTESALMGKTHLTGFQEAPLQHRVVVTRKTSPRFGVK